MVAVVADGGALVAGWVLVQPVEKMRGMGEKWVSVGADLGVNSLGQLADLSGLKMMANIHVLPPKNQL